MLNFNYDNAPNPSKFLESYRYLGYNNYSAIADLVDNCFDADADNVWITTQKVDTNHFVISISDDGTGMDKDTLAQAFRLGALTERDPEKDLGVYGVGSASASLSLARHTMVITKAEDSSCFVKVVDFDYMKNNNTFDVRLDEASKDEKALLEHMCGNAPTGTCVILEKCDQIKSKTNITQFNNQLRKHLGQIFRVFLSVGKKIFINDEQIPVIDPLLVKGIAFNDEKYETQIFSDEEYELRIPDGKNAKIEKIRIRIALLPQMHKNIYKERWPKDIPAPSQPSQGFYVMRNEREIASGDSLGLFTKHNSLNRFRAEIFFNATIDDHMGVNFTKRKVNLSQSIFDQLNTYLKEQIATINKILKREVSAKAEDTQESFRESEALISRKDKLMIKRKQTEEQLKKEIEEQKKTHVAKTDKQVEREQKKFLDEAGRPKKYHFDTINLGSSGMFFESEKIGQTLVIKYNADHPFYTKFFSEKDKSTQNDLNFLMSSLVIAKRNLDDEQSLMIEAIEGLWSLNLKALLE